jgi:aspartate/methionine/tyrosine aminotransferase
MADPEYHKYHLVDGIPELIDALASKLEQENGICLGDESSVIVTAGSNMGFVNVVLAVADPGDEIILQTPYYFNHEMAIRMAGCVPVLVDTNSEYQLQPGAIRQAITPRTRAVVTVSPNNPSGAMYSEAMLQDVNALCRENGIYHVHDEAYEYFAFGETPHFSPGSIAGAASHTISLFSLSKAYGFASWRIGYMVTPSPLVSAVKKIQDTILICPPVISQFAAIGALRAGLVFCRRHLNSLAETRELVRSELERLGDLCEVSRADGAFYFLVRVKTNMADMEVTERLIREHGVAVLPGSAFGLTEGCTLRIAYGALQKASVADGMGRFVKGVRCLLDAN